MIKMGKYTEPKLHLPLILSIGIHAGVLFLLINVAPASTFRLRESVPNTKPVVHAVAIHASKVAEQVQNIQAREQRQHAQEQEKLHELQAQAAAARQAKKAEEQRLIQIKADQQQAQQQRETALKQAKLEELHLAQLKTQQLQQAQALALTQKKQQQEAAQAKASALKQQQENEAKALAVKKQHELEAKISAEKKQHELEAVQQKQAQLAQQHNELQQQLLQQQIANEQQQLVKAQQLQGAVDQYRAQILIAISRQWIIPDATDPTISCVFSIDLTPAGVVSRVQLVRGSGNVGLDRAAEAAIYKASPLPVPKDPTAMNTFRHFTLKMTPQDVNH